MTMPRFIIHLDTLKEDLSDLINHIQGDLANNETISIVNTFPHTHRAKDNEQTNVEKDNVQKIRKYFSKLKRSDIEELYDKYKLDHALFGYKLEDVLQNVHL